MKKQRIPSYRHHKPSGRAVCTLTDVHTGRRCDVYLGEHGTTESRQAYAKLIEQWEANGRTLDGIARTDSRPLGSVTATDLAVAYTEYLQSRHGDRPNYVRSLKPPIRLCRSLYGRTLVTQFGPRALQEVRTAMIAKGWRRSTVNRSVDRLVAMFRWGVAQELAPESAHRALACVGRLRRGEQGVKNNLVVKPVPAGGVRRVWPHISPQVRGVILLQWLTGCRVTEALRLRPIDIDTTGDVWLYKPVMHKTLDRGHDRVILIGPRAQRVLSRFMLGRPVDKPLFSPREAEKARYAARPNHRKNAPPRVPKTARKLGDAYTMDSYRRAIAEACRKAGIDSWSPRQLRKTALNRLRRLSDLETASIIAGHSSAELTDAVYTSRDLAKAAGVIGRVG